MPQKVYDAIIVGSGANGSWAAKTLTEAGMDVLMIEAGRRFTRADFSEHALPHDLPLRGRRDPRNVALARRPTQKICFACEETNAEFFIDDIDNPYTTEKGTTFNWVQGNMVGGRTVTWGRQSYRFSDYDFKAASRDGYGDDWPISYKDVAPFYDRVESYIGVSGRKEGLDILPDGEFLPPMAFSCGEELLRRAAAEMGDRVVTIGRVAVLTQPHRGRAACHYCGPCHRGCQTDSYWSSPNTTLADAERTGKLELVTEAIVRHVSMKDDGTADGVYYFDKQSGMGYEAKAKVVVLCASTLASTRILLNSAEGGLGNSSDVLGRYVMDHIYATGVMGNLPARDGARPELAKRPNGIYIPRFQNLDGAATRRRATKKDGFLRGYGFQGGENVTSYEHAYAMKGFGADWKQQVKDTSQSSMNLFGFGEILARKDNRVTLDPEKVDAWGIPVLRFNCSLGDNERAMVEDIVEEGRAMLERIGCESITELRMPWAMGSGIHEVGTARMGNDKKTSYLNQYQQSHDVKNLFVMDGSCYVSIGCVNPTLTMMALALRSSEYLIEQYRKGELS